MRDEETHDVLVVGAGPAGLTAAVTLARAGVRTLLVERRFELSSLPRATVISTRSMELLRAWGLEDAVLAGGVDVEWQLWACETLAAAPAGSAIRAGLPTREQSAALSPTAPGCVPQDHLEPVLLDHLRSFAAARVELGTELVDLEADAEGARALVRDRHSGATRWVGARYLIGADGSRSAVRAALGIAMRGPDRLARAVSALFRAPLWDVVGEHRYGLYAVSHPDAAGSLLPAGRGDRWLYGVLWDTDEQEPSALTEAEMSRRIRLASGVPGLRPGIERIGRFTFAAQIADRFRSASAFLVGDAAHRVTPRGGTGMNTAIHDGYDLGWKLAWVLRRWFGPDLLDSYASERRPVAEHNLARSADSEGSRREVAQEVHADLGGRIPHLWLHRTGGRISTLDLVGEGLTLFTGPQTASWEESAAAVSGPLPLAVRRLHAVDARALGVREGGALMVRPDGVPVGLWPDDRAFPGRTLGRWTSIRTGCSSEFAPAACL